MVLGQISIVSICAAFTMLSALKTPKAPDHERYESNALRSHSVLTPILARWLAQRFASPTSAARFIFEGIAPRYWRTGNRCLLRQTSWGHTSVRVWMHPDVSCYQAEQAVLGFDHQELGAEVLSYWHLPPL